MVYSCAPTSCAPSSTPSTAGIARQTTIAQNTQGVKPAHAEQPSHPLFEKDKICKIFLNAVETGNEETVKNLLKEYENNIYDLLTAKDPVSEEQALLLAIGNENPETATKLTKILLEAIKKLPIEQRKEILTAPSSFGVGIRPLLAAVQAKNPEIVALLAGSKELDLNPPATHESKTPLSAAREFANTKILEILQSAIAQREIP